jgi:hypothetical protein
MSWKWRTWHPAGLKWRWLPSSCAPYCSARGWCCKDGGQDGRDEAIDAISSTGCFTAISTGTEKLTLHLYWYLYLYLYLRALPVLILILIVFPIFLIVDIIDVSRPVPDHACIIIHVNIVITESSTFSLASILQWRSCRPPPSQSHCVHDNCWCCCCCCWWCCCCPGLTGLISSFPFAGVHRSHHS